jgi:hypothetical protein
MLPLDISLGCFKITVLMLSMLLCGCAVGVSKESRLALAEEIAAAGNMQFVDFSLAEASPLRIMGFVKNIAAGTDCAILTVYIEGDGLAFIRKNTVSNDPTPVDPMGLRFAVVDRSPLVLYLSRPCQYITNKEMNDCNNRLWTSARYSAEIVSWYDAVLDAAKKRYNAKYIRLVGYSGGGSLAVLLAALRQDVTSLVTIAGNLDTQAWTELHGVSRLTDSLNPTSVVVSVANIPQVHYVGTRDMITPPSLCQRFLAKMPPGAPAKCQLVEGADHHGGLVAAWTTLCAHDVSESVF